MAKLKVDYFGKGVGDSTNCFPRAVANATGMDYESALKLCVDFGYDNGMALDHIAKMAVVLEEMTIVVCEWKDGKAISHVTESIAESISPSRFPRCTAKKLTEALTGEGSRWIVATRKHAFAIVEGKVYDNGATGELDRIALIIKCKKVENSYEEDFQEYEDYV